MTEELLCLARGPMRSAIKYEGYITNGFSFHTKKRQRNRKTQNSSVVVKGDSESGEKDFYGVLEEVIILEYDTLVNRTSPRIALFKCRWFDVFNEGRGIKRDKFGCTFVNVSRRLQTNEPFALASQIEQVFYTATHNQQPWRLVIKTSPQNYFDFPNDDGNDTNESLWIDAPNEVANVVDVQEGSGEEIALVRVDVDPNLVDVKVIQQL